MHHVPSIQPHLSSFLLPSNLSFPTPQPFSIPISPYPSQQQMMQHQQHQPRGTEGIKSLFPDKGPSTSQVIAVATLVPVGGILLTLAGVTLAGTVIGLALTTPLFVIFSPILVPAAIAIALAIMGFLASGAFGITGLSSLTWIFNHFKGMRTGLTEPVDYAKRRMQEVAGQVGQKTKEVGQGIQSRSQEGGGGGAGGRTTAAGGGTTPPTTTEGGRTSNERRKDDMK